MGKYINQDSKGNQVGASYQNKVNSLIADGATVLNSSALQFQPGLVCVVDNGMFAAAGYAYSEGEFKEFSRNDGRQKTWLYYPHAEAIAR